MSVKVAAGSEHYYAPEAKGAQLAVSWLSLSPVKLPLSAEFKHNRVLNFFKAKSYKA